MWTDAILALAGLALVLAAAERAVPALLGVSSRVGISAFLLGVVLLGFDIENLGVGAVAGVEGSAGIALGTILGSAMVAIALALGITALIAPLAFRRVPKRILVLPAGAALLLWALAGDGRLGRLDGVLLLLAYAAALWALLWLERRGVAIEGLERARAKAERRSGSVGGVLRATAVLLLALGGLVLGSELLVRGARGLIAELGLSETVIGMSVIALAVSIEEVARELPAAIKGHPEIALGNVIGSVFAFFLFNAGVIALLAPLPVGAEVRGLYLPAAVAGVLLVCGLLAGFGRISRPAGLVLLLAYLAFTAGGALQSAPGA